MKRTKWLVAAGAALLAWSGQPAAAQEVTLIFGTGNAPDNSIVTGIYNPWVAVVNAAGKGVVQIDQRDGQALLNSRNFYNQVTKDIVQIGFGALEYVGGKFQLSTVTTLPLLVKSATVGSTAFWKLYASGALAADFDEVVPLYFITYPPYTLHFRKPLTNAKDLTGQKIVASNRQLADMVQLLGASPITLTYQEVYSALQRGAVDGMSFPFAGVISQKFDEITVSHLNVGLGSATAMVFMEKKKFEGLSPAARKILLDNSGEAISRKQGELFDKLTNEAIAQLKADSKHKVVEPSQDDQLAFAKKLESIQVDWLKESAGRDKILAQYKTLLQQVEAGR